MFAATRSVAGFPGAATTLTLPYGPEVIERDAEDRVTADLADSPDRDGGAEWIGLDLVGRQREDHLATALAEQRSRIVRKIEPGADARVQRGFGERDGEAAVGHVVREGATGSRGGDELDQRHLGPQVERRRRARDGAVASLELRARERRGPGRGQHDRVARLPGARNASNIGHEPDAAHDRRGMDRAAVGVVVERDVAGDDRQRERLARLRHALDRLGELPPDLGLLRVAEVEAVGEPERLAPGAGDVARCFENRGSATRERVERADAPRAVEREREAAVRRSQAQHGCVESRPAHGARLDELVVAARHERPRAECIRAE